jgi:hypothetical protein
VGIFWLYSLFSNRSRLSFSFSLCGKATKSFAPCSACYTFQSLCSKKSKYFDFSEHFSKFAIINQFLMKRKISSSLVEWKDSEERKPLNFKWGASSWENLYFRRVWQRTL